MSSNDIQNMSVVERMYLMEQLWDSIRQDKEDLTTPLWHENILKDRKLRYENGELKTFTLDEIKASLL
jgi:putative addiction module component (TIGR02574 family)